MGSFLAMFRVVLFALLVGAALPPQPAFPDTWRLDKDHSEIRFSWDHLGLSRKSGRFLDFDATLDFTPTDPVAGSVTVTIKSASISTGVKALDDALRSPDFFNTAAHPTITYKSTGVRKTGDKTGEIIGDLTLLGVTKPVTLKATWNYTGEYPLASVNPVYLGQWVSGFSATARIERSAFGLKRATPLISDEIEIAIEVQFLRRP